MTNCESKEESHTNGGNMISVNEALPNLEHLISVPVRFVVDGKEYEGTYHENGWFYSSGWMLGKRGGEEMMAQGPRAECRMQTWGELPKHKATAWEYLSSNAALTGAEGVRVKGTVMQRGDEDAKR